MKGVALGLRTRKPGSCPPGYTESPSILLAEAQADWALASILERMGLVLAVTALVERAGPLRGPRISLLIKDIAIGECHK